MSWFYANNSIPCFFLWAFRAVGPPRSIQPPTSFGFHRMSFSRTGASRLLISGSDRFRSLCVHIISPCGFKKAWHEAPCGRHCGTCLHLDFHDFDWDEEWRARRVFIAHVEFDTGNVDEGSWLRWWEPGVWWLAAPASESGGSNIGQLLFWWCSSSIESQFIGWKSRSDFYWLPRTFSKMKTQDLLIVRWWCLYVVHFLEVWLDCLFCSSCAAYGGDLCAPTSGCSPWWDHLFFFFFFLGVCIFIVFQMFYWCRG
jgi:hypothetical protein